MKKINRIKEEVESLRDKLLRLIQLNDNLVDPEVIKASTLLDHALNEYNNVIARGFRHC